MEHLGRKLWKTPDGRIGFTCPGCNLSHLVPISGPSGKTWAFNGDGDRPTITPCIVWEDGETYCHCVVSGGEIAFLADSFHHLSGQTVPLPDVGEMPC